MEILRGMELPLPLAVTRQPRRPRRALGTYPFLQQSEELLTLVGAENAPVFEQVLDNHLLHGLLKRANLVQSALNGRAIRRVSGDRVNQFGVPADNIFPDAVDGAKKPVPAGYDARPLIIVQANFLVCKCRT